MSNLTPELPLHPLAQLAAMLGESIPPIPAQALAELSRLWTWRAARFDGDARRAIEVCVMDLDRLREIYCPSDTNQTDEIEKS